MLLENDFKNDVRVEKEVQTLFSAGHEIIVAGITSSDLTFEERRENCLVLRKNISKLIYRSSVGALKFPLYFNFWRRYIKNILCNYKIDAIHVHDLPLGCIGREFSKKFKVKFVLDLHENWPALLAISTHTNTFLGKLKVIFKAARSFLNTNTSNLSQLDKDEYGHYLHVQERRLQ